MNVFVFEIFAVASRTSDIIINDSINVRWRLSDAYAHVLPSDCAVLISGLSGKQAGQASVFE